MCIFLPDSSEKSVGSIEASFCMGNKKGPY
jgi:hypothetical protein